MKLELPLIFGEGMVLQRGKEIPVWGRGLKDDTIRVTLGTEEREAVCGADGCFCVTFPPMEACARTSLSVCSEMNGERIELHDIAVGEVWLCGGQSNMEFLLKYDTEAEDYLKTDDDPDLRYFEYPHTNFRGVETLGSFAHQGVWWKWGKRPHREMFADIPYVMARILREKLGVPVGMIGCNWGGTPAAAWASMDEIRNTPEMAPILAWQEENLKKLDWRPYYEASERPEPPVSPEQQEMMDNFMKGIGLKEFMERMAANTAPPPMPVYSAYVPGPRACIRPAGLYDSMLIHIAPYAIRGAIWYQGEDDDFRGWQDFYKESMKAVIRSWRGLFGQDIPFYQVDLAPFMGRGATGAKKYPEMRQAQHDSSVEMPKAKDVCIMDLGDDINIHFRDKQKAGVRLANLALRYDYGFDVKADSPELESADRDGDSIVLRFKYAENGLVYDTALPDAEGALLVYADGTAVLPEILIKDDTLVLVSEAFIHAEKISVQYAWQNYCRSSLFDTSGLPVFPFTWEG